MSRNLFVMSLDRCLLVLLATASSVVSLHVAAQPVGGSVFYSGGFTQGGQFAPFAGCEGTGGPKICVVPGARAASVEADGHFVAPQAFDPNNPAAYQLAEIGASARTLSEAYSSFGFSADRPSIQDVSRAVQVSSFAVFTDYLLLGATPPNSLSLVFELSGGVSLDPLYATSGQGGEAKAIYTVGAQSGTFSGDGSFGSFEPFAVGSVIVEQKLTAGGGPATIQTFPSSNPVSSFTHTSTLQPNGTSLVNIVLGPEFFSNQDNSVVLLGMSLFVSARAPEFFFNEGLPYDTSVFGVAASADFNHTFKLISLNALDIDGNDITADAIGGFASMSAVPLPAPLGFLALGLGALARLRRRRCAA